MSLTNRILLAMVLGIGLGSVLEVVLGSLSPDSSLYGFLYNGMVMGLFDVLGRIARLEGYPCCWNDQPFDV